MAIIYANKALLTNEDNLSIYTYNEPASTWSKVASTIDKVKKTVTADLAHFSYYTLSAEMPEDAEAPQVSLIDPENLAGLSGSTAFQINASDNEAVFKVSTLIDDKLINSDSDSTDGWNFNLDMNDYSVGNHKLTLLAEDAAGNTGEANYDFTINNSTFVAPQINLFQPLENSYLAGSSNVMGTFISPNGVDSINIFLDNVFIANVNIDSQNYQQTIDWSQFVDGNHNLKVTLTDQRGNQASIERSITLGVKAEITSPQEKTYLHAETIPIEFESDPENMTAKIDGNAISNHSQVDAYTLSLGQHTFTVEYDGKMIAQRQFTVNTTISDLINLVSKFYSEGRFKNQGMRDSIIEKLTATQVSESLDQINQRNKLLSQLIGFIIQKNTTKNPLIDDVSAGVLKRDLGYLLVLKS